MSSICYRFICNQEGIYFNESRNTPPTKCPNNPAHTVSILEQQHLQQVIIKEEFNGPGQVPTNGFFRAQGFQITCPASTTTSHIFSWDYPISPTVLKVCVNDNNVGDVVNVFIAPETIIGAITSGVSSGSSTLSVSPTVLQYLSVGFLCKITDGTQSQVLGEAISINKTLSTITVATPLTSSYSAGALIKMTINNIKDFYLVQKGMTVLGDSRIGSTYLPVGTIVKVEYKNNSLDSKTFTWITEYMY